ncbi:synaptonemal complex protein 2-like [Tachyglossus aculeatus]|uniref:synaptonemal complex protein 2-like n=1 Tax=Tachyglossus aculeatus TaxID=9261 RepID=UPI0018F7A07F|nr:synaptonemal complex protein 2-like [Tachyglossus aculeatus]
MQAIKEKETTSPNAKGDKDTKTAPDEFYFQSLITDVFHGKGFQKINELFPLKVTYVPQKCDKVLLNHLDRLINKELDKNEFHNVSLLLKCIKQFFKGDLKEDEHLLIRYGLISKMVSWFERTIGFLTIKELALTPSLINVTEDFFDIALVILKCSSEGKIQLLDSFLLSIGLAVTEKKINFIIRQEALRTLNSILDTLPREERKKLSLSEDIHVLTQDLARTILEIGDYDLQAAISEALCRLMAKKSRNNLAHKWFEDSFIALAFKEIKDRDFETDSRKFLNLLNNRLGDERGVYSFPCIAAFADKNEVRKPTDEKLEKFWIDFNIGSQSITFYIDNAEGLLWDSVRLEKKAVRSYGVKESQGKIVFHVNLKNLLTVGKKEVKKIEIHFDSQFSILNSSIKVLGEDKLLSTSTKGKQESSPVVSNNFENQTVEMSDSTLLQLEEEPSQNEKTSSVSDLSASDIRDPSETAKMNSTGPSAEMHQMSKVEDTGIDQEVSPKQNNSDSSRFNGQPSKTPEMKSLEVLVVEVHSSEEDVSEKKSQATNPNKTISETKEDIYDFGHSSDSLSHQLVTSAKQKYLSKNSLPVKTRGNKQDTKLETSSGSLRKHLFSESNFETSNGTSEIPWINEQKEKSAKSYPSKKKPRVRSKLKVLPLSSASSGSDHQKTKSRLRSSQKEAPRKKPNPASAVATIEGLSVFLTPEDSNLKPSPVLPDDSEASALSSLGVASYPELSDYEEEKLQSVDHKSEKESPSKRKLKNLGFVGNDLIKLKHSKLEPSSITSHFPATIQQKELFPLLKEEKEPFAEQEGDPGDLLVPDESTKSLAESPIISTFETFTRELKKKFWSRYRKEELCAKNATAASENIIMLLNQIHQCRLDKLEQFHRIVLQELANLERDAQTLTDLEGDILEFWKKQSEELNSFCGLQKQRLQSMSSTLGPPISDSVQDTQAELPEEKMGEDEVVKAAAGENK